MAQPAAHKPVIVLCGGGHARVVINALISMKRVVLGIVDEDSDLAGQNILGLPVLGSESALKMYSPEKVTLVNGLGGLKSMTPRTELFERFKKQGYEFLTVIHPSAIIGMDVEFSEGAQIMAGAVIQTGSRIGSNSIINTTASVDHDCIIGRNVHIAPGVTLCGAVLVGDGAYIGSGATIIPGITVGKDVLVKAGTTVIRDVVNQSQKSNR